MVNKINPEKEAWNLKVRVIRLWTVPTFTGQLLPNSMEMILVDESVSYRGLNLLKIFGCLFFVFRCVSSYLFYIEV